MPAYPGAAHGTTTNTTPPLPPGIYPGDSATVINAEGLVAGQASQAVALGGVYENHPGTLTVEGFFSGAPGVFELDLQTADTDADAFYTNEGSAINALVDSTANSFRAEFPNVSANFARVLIKTLPNAVNITVRITRK